MSRWLFFPSPVGGETILDTYSFTGNKWTWISGNNWWKDLHLGTWTSTGTATGTYLKLDSGSLVRTDNLTFSASDPGGWPATARIRMIVTPSTGGAAYAVEGTPTGAGDSRWFWRDSGGTAVVFTTAEFEDGGTFGWNESDAVTIELFTP
jgi:hypothetical protein